MPVPTVITDLSTTAASNSPAGPDAVFPNLDDYLRAHAAFIAQLNATDATKVAKAGDTMTGFLTLNAAPTSNLHAATKQYVDGGLAGRAPASHTHIWGEIDEKGRTQGPDNQDPNTTTFAVCVTAHVNMPDGGSTYWHLTTTFHTATTLAAAVNKSQVAISFANQVYTRTYGSGTWTPWVRCDLGQVSALKSGTGYVVLPSGVMLQWGSISHGGGGNVAVSFPIAFPNAAVAVVPNSVYNGGANNPSAHSKSASGFTCYWTGSGTITIDYIAIGY